MNSQVASAFLLKAQRVRLGHEFTGHSREALGKWMVSKRAQRELCLHGQPEENSPAALQSAEINHEKSTRQRRGPLEHWEQSAETPKALLSRSTLALGQGQFYTSQHNFESGLTELNISQLTAHINKVQHWIWEQHNRTLNSTVLTVPSSPQKFKFRIFDCMKISEISYSRSLFSQFFSGT